MNTIRNIAKNTIILFISEIISKIFGFFYIIYTARYLGVEEFGILSFSLAFVGIFAIFADLGLNTFTVRQIARNKEITKKHLSNTILLKSILIIITLVLIVLFVNILGYPQKTINIVYLLSLSITINSVTGLFYSIFQAYEKMEYQSIGQILYSIILFTGTIIAIIEEYDVLVFAAIYFITSLLVLTYCLCVSYIKFVLPTIEADFSYIKNIFVEALPFGLIGIFVTIYYYIDTVMLSLLVINPDQIIGWYNAAYRLVLFLLFVPTVYFSSVFPVMSRLFKTSEKSLKFLFERSFKYMTIMAIPMGVGTTIIADKIIVLLYGIEYEPATIALQILIWSSVFIFMSLNFGHLLNSINKQLVVTKVTGIGALVNIILNLLIIPMYGYIGASATTVATEAIILLIELIIVSKIGYEILNRSTLKTTLKIIIASAVMGIVALYLKNFDLILIIACSVAIYIISLIILRVFDTEDFSLLKTLLHKK